MIAFPCPRCGTQIQDFGFLRGLRLTGLSLFGCAVRGLTPLKDMPLNSLNLQSCNHIQDLTPHRIHASGRI